MPTFIDESGDTGELPVSSARYFSLVAVHLPTHDDAENLRIRIRELRRELQLKSNFEFKYSRLSNYRERRLRFIETIATSRLQFAFCRLDKAESKKTKNSRVEIFRECINPIAECFAPVYLQAESETGHFGGEIVVIDDNQDQQFLNATREAFCKFTSDLKPGRKLVRKVRFQGSQPDEMLQVADMVVGLTSDHFCKADDGLFDIIKTRCLLKLTV